MRPFAARLGAVLIGVTGFGLFGAAPAEAQGGFTTELSGVPQQFVAGDGVSRVAAVVSGRTGGQCQKVRWSLLVRTDGLLLDQVRINRIEETGQFPVQVQEEGNSARITDRQLDPGTLCDDRTVTAQYDVEIADDVTDGRITLAAEAYDVNLNLISRQTVEREVISERSQQAPADRAEREPAETEPAEEPDAADGGESPEAGAAPPAGAEPGAGAGDAGQTDAAAQTSGGTGLVQAGFVIGAVMLFLGVGLLVRLRHRLVDGEDEEPSVYGRSHASRVPTRRRRPVRY